MLSSGTGTKIRMDLAFATIGYGVMLHRALTGLRNVLIVTILFQQFILEPWRYPAMEKITTVTV
jgi:hypothetical protein